SLFFLFEYALANHFFLLSLHDALPISDSLAWIEVYFAVPVLSAVVHVDEAAPHMHVLLLPLLNGRMQGSDLVGSRSRLRAMQSEDRKSTRLNSSHGSISYAVFCLTIIE